MTTIEPQYISENFDKLYQAAKAIRLKAHAPYSEFLVGAALLTEKNNIAVGCNIENAAYPQTQCAEASAIGNMISLGDRIITEVVVVGSGKLVCSPCGGCRQRLREFANLSTLIHMCNENEYQKTMTLEELLPESFGPENL